MDLHCNIRASFDVCTHLTVDLIVFVHGEKAYLLPVALRKKNKKLLMTYDLKNMNEDLRLDALYDL